MNLVHRDKERVAAWVAERIGVSGKWGGFYAIGVERDGELTAGIVMNNYSGTNATCHIAVSRPGKDMIALFKAFCDYAFNQCGMKRLTGIVPMSMPDVIEFDKKLGFEEEFVIKDGDMTGDLQMMVMWRDKCRWIAQEAKA